MATLDIAEPPTNENPNLHNDAQCKKELSTSSAAALTCFLHREPLPGSVPKNPHGTTQNVNKQGCGTFLSPGRSNSNTRGDEFDLVTPEIPGSDVIMTSS